MSGPTRLPPVAGEWIDRQRPLHFVFEGQSIPAYAGDTITSALLAAGRSALGRSFKYHRPRGVLSAANHDINVLVQSNERINIRADISPVEADMVVRAVNTWGGVTCDRGFVLDRLSRFLPVGFYYKAFYNKRLFPLWERLFRRVAGLGVINLKAPRLRTVTRYAFCDVLVIGAGPSGLAAAIAAADCGAQVVLVDENAHIGGSATYHPTGFLDAGLDMQALITKVRTHPGIDVRAGTCAAGYYAGHSVALAEAQHMTKMQARAVVCATGLWEQPAVFRNNDLPGILLGSAALRLLYRYAIRPMERAVLLVANAEGYEVAKALKAHGVSIALIVDMRPAPKEAQDLRAQGVEVCAASGIIEAVPTPDRLGVAAVRIAPMTRAGQAPPSYREVACDGVILSTGFAPAAAILCQAGGRLTYDQALEQWVPGELPAGLFACGRVNGVFAPGARLADGRRAGGLAAAHAGCRETDCPAVARDTVAHSHPWPFVSHPRGREFLDFDEDLQYQDYVHAAKEGFDTSELLKRYTTTGMGPSQGKHSHMNALRLLAHIRHETPQAIGITTARPFVHPVPLAVLAGHGLHPRRRTAAHKLHEDLGAVFVEAATWLRPAYYQVAGLSKEACIEREVRAVRERVGIIDVAPLGKIEIAGPDALAFIERVYTSRCANIAPGETRYALLCDEAGTLIDDGVIARRDAACFYGTTSTGGAVVITRELSRLIALWAMDCVLTPYTGQFFAANLAGPRARAVLEPLTDIDLSPQACPYRAYREGHVAGIPARIMRMGFVGEWSYEIHVPANLGAALWEALMRAGQDHGIGPFGVEAQRILRLEKGHIIVGQDTDGATHPREAGLGWAVHFDKPFFVGQRSLAILHAKPLSRVLVGFILKAARDDALPEEGHLIIAHNEVAGRVTSIAWSPTLRRHIGLAYVTPSVSEIGGVITIRRRDGRLTEALVSPLPFYDPLQERQKEAS